MKSASMKTAGKRCANLCMSVEKKESDGGQISDQESVKNRSENSSHEGRTNASGYTTSDQYIGQERRARYIVPLRTLLQGGSLQKTFGGMSKWGNLQRHGSEGIIRARLRGNGRHCRSERMAPTI